MLTLLGGPMTPSAAAPDTPASEAPQPIVVGAQLRDARTTRVWVPHGANWPSFEYACWQGWGYSQPTSSAEARLIASWGLDLIRLPLNQDCWLGLNGAPVGAGRTASGYRDAVETWVDQLHAEGIAVILDLHISAPAGVPAHGQRAMPDSQSVAFWASVAARFSSDRSVMFDLFNEPYSRWAPGGAPGFALSWACWRDGGCHPPIEDDEAPSLSGGSYPAVGMATLLSTVRSAGATQPVLLAGVDYANDLTGWLAHRPSDDQLVASWHNYPGQQCMSQSCWNSVIAPIAAQVPVIATEFGQTDGNSDFVEGFLSWADAHGVGVSPWAWWRVSPVESLPNSRYALVDEAGQPNAPVGTAFHAHLATHAPRPEIAVSRTWGADRYQTAIAVSRKAYPTGAPVVFIANGEAFPDALSAGPAAAFQGGPLLLVQATAVPASVGAELQRLHPSRIVIVGGKGVVSASVGAALAAYAPSISRLEGANRYATTATVASTVFSAAHVDVVYVASGDDYPDALSAGAAAGVRHAPVLVVPGRAGALPAETRGALESLAPARIVIVGGPGVVGAPIATELARFATTTRVSGDDRYATSAAVSASAFASADTVILTAGSGFADGLAASAWGGAAGAPVLLSDARCVRTNALAEITRLGASTVVLIGGTGVLGLAVESLAPC